jgi:hypothetical protein
MLIKKLFWGLIFLLILSNPILYQAKTSPINDNYPNVYYPHQPINDIKIISLQLERNATYFPLPPDAKIIVVSYHGRDITNLCHFEELWMRCYKFGFVRFKTEDLPNLAGQILNVTYTYGQPFQINNQTDSLIEQTFSNDFVPNDYTSLPLYEPYLKSSLEKAGSGYPIYKVNKSNSNLLTVNTKYQYVIVVPEAWKDEFNNFIKIKESKGIKTYVVTLEWINANYNGKDISEKIKEFTKDAFNNWKIIYLLLVGDNNIIPIRQQTITFKCTDAYFSCLDSDWNEAEKVKMVYNMADEFIPLKDWMPDIIVGRMPISNIQDLRNIIQKVIIYENYDPNADWYNRGISLLGWDLGEVTYDKGIIVDYLSEDIPSLRAHASGVDMKTYINGYNITTGKVIEELNRGQCIVTGTLHGGIVLTSNDELTINKMSIINNKGKYPVWFINGCGITDFTQTDNLATYLLKKADSGIIVGAGGSGGIVVPRWFFFGEVREGYKTNYARGRPGIAFYQGSLYESISCIFSPTYNFIGDPEISSWLGITKMPEVKIYLEKKSLLINETAKIKVYDNETDIPVENAIVRIINKKTNDYFETITDDNGEAIFYPPKNAGEYSYDVFVLIGNKPTKTSITLNKLSTSNISCTVSSKEIFFNQNITINGVLEPKLPNETISLTLVKPDNSIFQKNITTDSEGGYSIPLNVNRVGGWQAKARWMGNTDYLECSNNIYFDVVKTQSHITCAVNDTKIIMGKCIVISGILTPKFVGRIKMNMNVSSFTTTTYLIPDTSGNYQYIFRPDKPGFWSVQVTWVGNETYSGSNSQVISFNVLKANGTSRVYVKDESGKLMSGVSVSSTSQPGGQTTVSGITNSSGVVEFREVKIGSYSFMTSVNGYDSNTGSMNIGAEETTDVTIILKKTTSFGIPSYPIEGIILGVSIVLAIFWISKHT